MSPRHLVLASLVLLRPLCAQDGSDFVTPTDSELADAAVAAAREGVAADAPGSRVDVLVVYTAAARSYAGGPDAMRAAINTYVALTNQCYANSDVAVTLRLVGTQEVSYTENSNMATDLSRLANGSDGYMDEVPTLRTAVGADLVCLIRRGAAGGAAGIGYLGGTNPSYSSYAFTVVADDWASANLTFPHELGHNFGCHHDRANAGSTPADTYNYGHRFNGNDAVQYRTVMAYAPGTRIPYFSNPSISYQGVATGVAVGQPSAADNALVHEQSVANLAAYRADGTYTPSGVRADFDGNGTPDILWSDTATGQRVVWLYNGVTRIGGMQLGTIDRAWRIEGSADFNGDGSPDIVWTNTSTGQRVCWYYRGTTRVGGTTIGTVATNWQMSAFGDFNGDGKTDIVWTDANTGQRVVWYYDGVVRTGGTTLATVATNWQINGAGDFNGDGKTDLVWTEATTGQRVVWFYNGVTRIGGATIETTPTAWRIDGVADFNQDNNPDLLVSNTSTGARVVWLMSGATHTSTLTVGTVSTGWVIGNR